MGGWRSADQSALTQAASVADLHPEAGVEELQRILHRDWLAPAEPTTAAQRTAFTVLPPLFGELREAHAGRTRWLSESVVVARSAGGMIVAGRPGESPRSLLPGDYTRPVGSRRQGLVPYLGEPLLVTDRRDAPPTDGWWPSWGPGWDHANPPERLVRLTFAVQPAEVTSVVHRLTGALRELPMPWLLRVAADRAALTRADAASILLPSDDVNGFDRSPWLHRLVSVVDGLVRPVAMPLALSVAPGVTLVEQPAGDDFDVHRSRLVAQALRAAGSTGPRGADPLDLVAERFRAAGLDPARPYLRPGSGQRA